MFCPVCRSEYRSGFTKCADCGVDLVEHLPADELAADRDVQRDADGRELLWSGVPSGLYDAIRAALDSAGISHKDIDKEFGLLPNLAQSAQFVWIDPRDRAAARSILAEVLAKPQAVEQQNEQFATDAAEVDPFGLNRGVHSRPSDMEDGKSEDELPESNAPDEPTPDDIVEDFDPEDATAEVWSGEDAEMAQVLNDCLSGVGLGCVQSHNGSHIRVLVLPATAARAKEIVREVVEGTPPE
ncbi:MAG: hypothetical protein ABSG27_08290 [Candidatus Acidiferrales bacterium]|jgi:hypothetical protein